MARVRLILVVDAVVVLTLLGTALAQLGLDPPEDLQGGRGVHAVLASACIAPLLVRRRSPVVVFLVVLTAAWLQFQLGGGLGQPFFAALLALYSVGSSASWPATLVGPASVLLQAVVIDVPRLRDGDPWEDVVPAWFILLGIWGFGRWMRRRAREAELLVQRAEAAEHDTQEQAARAVAAERARIARELHDLVAHSMGVIVIQSQGAQRAMDQAPDRARQALTSIEDAGRGALAEMRRLLGLLSEDAGEAGTAPQPGLQDVPLLVDRVRATGVTVDLSVEGEAHPLPAGVELAAYRVVQEALTNSLKHGNEPRVAVRLRYGTDSLEIEVQDDGATQRNGRVRLDSGGRGLVGMRERVSLYGGTLSTGFCSEGGFLVKARLPVQGPVA